MAKARIDEVDYRGFPTVAKGMRSDAEKMNKEVIELYNTLKEMKKDWYGPRYDQLVKGFNKMIPDFDNMLKLTVTQVPASLEKIANNYAKVDIGAAITTAVEKATKKITNVALSAKKTLRFEDSAVEAKKQQMEKKLDEVNKLMNSIEAKYNKLNWKSDASDEFKKTFKKLKTNIVKNTTAIKKDFKKLMEQSATDMRKAEQANNVSKSVKKSVK